MYKDDYIFRESHDCILKDGKQIGVTCLQWRLGVLYICRGIFIFGLTDLLQIIIIGPIVMPCWLLAWRPACLSGMPIPV